MVLFPALFYISRSALSIENAINWSVWAEHPTNSPFHTTKARLSSVSSISNTVVIFTLVRCRHYHRTTTQCNTTMIDFFPPRSKREVEKKANYPNIRNKRSLFSMLEKRLPHRGFKPEDKKWLNWVHVCWCLHWASSDRLCFINQVDVISYINYVRNRIDNSI